jgi:hypothetical protein
LTLAAFAPAAPEGAGADGGLCDVCAVWGCGVSGKGSSCFWPAVLDWLDWGELAKSGISPEIRNTLANMAIRKHFEYLRTVRFIFMHPKVPEL